MTRAVMEVMTGAGGRAVDDGRCKSAGGGGGETSLDASRDGAESDLKAAW